MIVKIQMSGGTGSDRFIGSEGKAEKYIRKI